MPDGMSLKKIDTVVPPSSASNVTTMIISPEKAGSTESKVIASTILLGGRRITNQKIYLSSLALVLPRKVFSDAGYYSDI